MYDARAHTWSTIKESIGELPPKMSAHAAVAHYQKTTGGMQVSSKILVYGGSCMVPDDSVTVEGDPVGGYRETTSHDAYMFDVDEARWLKLTHGPIYPNPRRGHSMAVMDGWRPSWFEPENWGFKARYGVLAPNMPKVAPSTTPTTRPSAVFAVVYGASTVVLQQRHAPRHEAFVVAKLEPIMPARTAADPRTRQYDAADEEEGDDALAVDAGNFVRRGLSAEGIDLGEAAVHEPAEALRPKESST